MVDVAANVQLTPGLFGIYEQRTIGKEGTRIGPEVSPVPAR